MKTKKIITFVFLFIMMAGLGAIAYGYWTSGVLNPSDKTGGGSIDIGEGDEISTQISLDDFLSDAEGKKLIPHTMEDALKEGEVIAVELSINVIWTYLDEEELMTAEGEVITKYLIITCTKVATVDDEGEEIEEIDAELFVITIKAGNEAEITFNDLTGVDVVIEVKLNEPATKDEYDSIANQKIIFTFNFAVVDSLE